MGWRSKAARLLGVGVAAMALLRAELATGFGRGTGVNRLRISPLGVMTHVAMENKHKLPWPQARVFTDKLMTALAAPGELALDAAAWAHKEGLVDELPKAWQKPAPSKKSNRKAKVTLEGRARDWCSLQQRNPGMKKLIDDNTNTFVIVGAVVTFWAMVASMFLPIDGFQNTLLGLGCFWFGANGAHGSNIQFTETFYGLVVVLILAIAFLPDWSSGKDDSSKDAKAKAKKKAKKAESVEDEWDDGIGGVSMETLRKRKQQEGAGDCCGGH